MTNIWELIVNSYSENPRDVLTSGGKVYFYVYVEDGKVFLESGRNHANKSKITGRRQLDESNLTTIYNEYKSGAKPSDLLNITFNSVYWFGIFKDLEL
ncbi:MAG: hypothetical protein E7557_09295 [Ruminococcaceae bacterium]|nr:hypothetical protein [Oscillospiraceae bacterium]